MATTVSSVEEKTKQIGRQIFDRVSQQKKGFFHADLDARMMDWAMKDEDMKVQLFRFVDVLPMLKTSEDIMRHLQEYLTDFPVLGQWGINIAASSGLTSRVAAGVVKGKTEGMAKKFITGSNVKEASDVIEKLRKQNMAFTMDILGEVTVSEEEGELYRDQYLELIKGMAEQAKRWKDNPLLDTAAGKPIPKVNVSIKLSALYSQFEPAAPEKTAAAVKEKLRPVLSLAKELGVFVHIDMEHYAIKDTTLKIFREIIMEPEYKDWKDIGIVLQAYLKDCEKDVKELIDLVKERGTPITVRLVKGAYWDYETVIARQRHWPIPVWTEKHETDACFERCVSMLLEAYPHVDLAIASHNIRSIAYVIAKSEELGLPKNAIEFQMLYGMGDPLKQAVIEQGQRLRIYAPFGELIPGMAYLVRRLLENTANESFLRQGFAEGISPEELLRNPEEIGKTAEPVHTFDQDKLAFPNLAERDFSKADHQELMKQALAKVKAQLGQYYPLIIDGKEVKTEKEIRSINPARPDEVVGRTASASQADAQAAIEAANRALLSWREVPAEKRAEYLLKAADIMEAERDELSALQVYEVGKNWREADADVCETIDYLRYYAKEMIRLSKPRRMGPVAGETNDYFYQPKGVAVIIPPWNFPMAICAGMSTAAIVTGNTVVLKPASQSPIVAAKFVEILNRAGLPAGVLNFLPGSGAEIGDYIVQHPNIHMIAFTGSREIGCRINKLAADVSPGQKHLKKVIAEMGGKNAIIVDSDADLDEAVLGVLHSAFGYQGQKCSACSRAIVLESCYDQFLKRLVEAAKSVHIGFPEDPGNYMGPVIDSNAYKTIKGYIEAGKKESRLMVERDVSHLGNGFFIGPTIFADVPRNAVIAQEEIFGPVLAVMKAKTLDEAIDIAMDVDYCLTGGIFSRSPANIAKAREQFRVGNLYINRKCTGAIVGRQPFGGMKMSGIGSKAGGPDYLLQFMDPRTVTENTLRRGFAPEED
ncbi:MAG TPA: L-glutamate gamma-semialdehyde dehydrogenase [Armatimonadota bacterium]|nr:L-glutamate gamma-semialdehyde dehydrogenase [Armatimonadota bacterium]